MTQMKCCCCGPCAVAPGKCCKCIKSTLCVTIDPPYADPCSVELDWDKAEKHFTGTLSCDGESHDLLFFFDSETAEETDDGYAHCYFKLRSESLGYPEGYEAKWIVGDEILCDTLEAGIDVGDFGDLSFKAVRKITPTECRGCKCLCECICVTAVSAYGQTYTGKVCWPDYGGSDYCGTLTNIDDEYDKIDVCVRFLKRGEVCDPSDYDCDPYDDRCVIAVTVEAWGVENQWDDIDPAQCRERGIAHHWDLPSGATVDIRCATCNEECSLDTVNCPEACPDTPPLPKKLHCAIYYHPEPCPEITDGDYPGTLVASTDLEWTGTRAPCDLMYWAKVIDFPDSPGNPAPDGWMLDIRFLCCGPALMGTLYIPGEANEYPYGDPSTGLGTPDANLQLFCDPFEIHARKGSIWGSDTFCFTYVLTE